MAEITISDLKNDINLAYLVNKITGFPSVEEGLDNLDEVDEFNEFLHDTLLVPFDSDFLIYTEDHEAYEDIIEKVIRPIEIDYSGLGLSSKAMDVIYEYSGLSDSLTPLFVEYSYKLYSIGESDAILCFILFDLMNNKKRVLKEINKLNDKDYQWLIDTYKTLELD